MYDNMTLKASNANNCGRNPWNKTKTETSRTPDPKRVKHK